MAASDLVPGKYEGERRAHDTRGGMGEPGGMGVPGGMGETGRARGELVFVGDASAPSPGRWGMGSGIPVVGETRWEAGHGGNRALALCGWCPHAGLHCSAPSSAVCTTHACH